MSQSKAGLYGILRLRGWGVGLSSLPMQMCYFTIVYLILKPGVNAPNLIHLLLLVLALALYLSYGVLINDFFDRDLDIAAGKFGPKRGHLNSRRELSFVLIFLLVAVTALIVIINQSIVFDATFVIALLLATVYSAPPLKLKTRGAWGFLSDSLIEKPLPMLIVFTFFGYYGLETLLFPLFGELFDSVFKHQVDDYELDSKFGVTSFAIQVGKERSLRAVKKIAHPLNAISVASLILVSYFELPKTDWFILASVPFIIVGLVAIAILERDAKVGVGFPFPDPPVVGYLNFGFRTFFLGSLAILVFASAEQYFLVSILVLFSIILYFIGFYKLVPDFMRYIVSRNRMR